MRNLAVQRKNLTMLALHTMSSRKASKTFLKRVHNLIAFRLSPLMAGTACRSFWHHLYELDNFCGIVMSWRNIYAHHIDIGVYVIVGV